VKLKLLTDPDPRLRKICAPISTFDDKVIELAESMKEYVIRAQGKRSHPNLVPVGVAAPQFGHLVQLFVIWTPEFEVTMVNPEIVKTVGSRRLLESCLSIPGRYFITNRPKIVKVRGLSIKGEAHSVKVHDFLAQAMMHEFEHLGGIMVDNVAITEVPKDLV